MAARVSENVEAPLEKEQKGSKEEQKGSKEEKKWGKAKGQQKSLQDQEEESSSKESQGRQSQQKPSQDQDEDSSKESQAQRKQQRSHQDRPDECARSKSLSDQKSQEDIQIPYGPIQQSMLARKTKACDLVIESRLREKVLDLSASIDAIDTEFLHTVFVSINSLDTKLCKSLSSPLNHTHSSIGYLQMHASEEDHSMSHLDLLEKVIERSKSQQKEMLIDVLNRLDLLRNGAFSSKKVDPKVMDILVYDLSSRLLNVANSEYARVKSSLIGKALQEIKKLKESGLFAHEQTLKYFVVDSDQAYDISVVTTGIPKENCLVDVQDDQIIVINGLASNENMKEANVVSSTMPQGRFMARISLPSKIDAKAIDVDFKEGMLKLKARKLRPSN